MFMISIQQRMIQLSPIVKEMMGDNEFIQSIDTKQDDTMNEILSRV